MTGGRLQTAGSGERTFAGVSIDSRTLKAGELFIALRGERVDGHNYIAQAIERGAAGLMTELSFQGPALKSDVAIVAVPNSHEAMMSLARQYRDMTSAKYFDGGHVELAQVLGPLGVGLTPNDPPSSTLS